MVSFRFAATLSLLALPLAAWAARLQDAQFLAAADAGLMRRRLPEPSVDDGADMLEPRWHNKHPAPSPPAANAAPAGAMCRPGHTCPAIANARSYCAGSTCAYKCLYGLDLVVKKIKLRNGQVKIKKICECNGVICPEPYPHGIGHVTCKRPAPHKPKVCGIFCPAGYYKGKTHKMPSCIPNGRLRS